MLPSKLQHLSFPCHTNTIRLIHPLSLQAIGKTPFICSTTLINSFVMDNLGKAKLVSIAFLLLVVSNGGFGEEEDVQGRMPVIDAAKKLFSLSSASDTSWIAKVKALFKHGWLNGIPPNLEEDGCAAGEEGATEKVREAVVKSLDKSKATVEDSAKSAAEFAEEAVHKTVKQIKKTFSGKFEAAGEL